MKITWTVEGSGAGEALVADTEEAVEAVQGALRSIAGAMDPEAAGRLLHSHWGPLRTALLTDGTTAVNAGESWSSTSGVITVNTYPRP